MPELLNPVTSLTQKTTEYRLKSGIHIGKDKDGNAVIFSPGELVPLLPHQYEAFADKFEELKAEERSRSAPQVQTKVEEPSKT